jgi:hypothetical protein
MYDFIKPLRAKNLKAFLPIVILCPAPPAEEHWLKVSAFPGVWVVRGSAMKAADLFRAGITSAACAVLYQQFDAAHEADDAVRSDALIDADAICIYRLVRSVAPATEIVVELARLESVTFLSDVSAEMDAYSNLRSGSRAEELLPSERSPFAAGHVFTSSFVDICLCQAFFNPHVIAIVESLVGISDARRWRKWNRSAAAQRLGAPITSNVFTLPVPASLAGRTFGSAFRVLCVRRGMLPLGIRRGGRDTRTPEARAAAQDLLRQLAGDDDSSSESESGQDECFGIDGRPPPLATAFPRHPATAYVITNPAASTVLRSTDSLFVLAARAPELPGKHDQDRTGLPRVMSMISASRGQSSSRLGGDDTTL